MKQIRNYNPLSEGKTSPGLPAVGPWLDIARKAAIEAGKAILGIYASGDFGEERKSDASPLTRADKAAHQVITEFLLPTGLPVLSEEGVTPPYAEREKWEWYWLVDPLDGTKEFLRKNGEFTVNIALMRKEVPVGGVVYAPVPDRLFLGSEETGVRRESGGEITSLPPLPETNTVQLLLHKPSLTLIASRSHRTPETEDFIRRFGNCRITTMGSSLKFMLLAENKADLYPRFGPTMEWDTAAAHAILRALNRAIYHTDMQQELRYNKPNLLNPSFIAC